jgi:hypothetical protein
LFEIQQADLFRLNRDARHVRKHRFDLTDPCASLFRPEIPFGGGSIFRDDTLNYFDAGRAANLQDAMWKGVGVYRERDPGMA